MNLERGHHVIAITACHRELQGRVPQQRQHGKGLHAQRAQDRPVANVACNACEASAQHVCAGVCLTVEFSKGEHGDEEHIDALLRSPNGL